AVECGSLEVCETLLKLGANVNAFNRSGDTPLHYAAMHGFTPIAAFLADNGAMLYARNHEGNTALHLAVETGSVDTCLGLLVELGFEVNVTSMSGDTPLHQAAMYGYMDICEMLLSRGALINAINHDGATPLDFAATD
ncbi:ankyrin repeat-containing domain protein, partial [Entophlyctis helioformis]